MKRPLFVAALATTVAVTAGIATAAITNITAAPSTSRVGSGREVGVVVSFRRATNDRVSSVRAQIYIPGRNGPAGPWATLSGGGTRFTGSVRAPSNPGRTDVTARIRVEVRSSTSRNPYTNQTAGSVTISPTGSGGGGTSDTPPPPPPI